MSMPGGFRVDAKDAGPEEQHLLESVSILCYMFK
jgi:hypothetical protein